MHKKEQSGVETEPVIIERSDKKGILSRLSLEDKIAAGTLGIAVGGAVFGFSCLFGAFGSRGIKTDFTSQYRGKPALVQHDDVRWGPDSYWILLDNRDKIYKGTIVSDDGRKIEVNMNGNPNYSTSDYKPLEE